MFTAINSEYHKLWYVQPMRCLANNEKEKKNTGCVSKTLCAEQKKKKSQIQKSKHCMIPHIQSSRIGETPLQC